MTNDPGQREPGGRRPRLELPRMVSVSSRLARFDPPARRNFDSALPTLTQTVEFLVETDEPIPVRALGPVLYVGDTPVTEVEAEDDLHYRFTALQPAGLRDGDQLLLGWSGQPRPEPASDRDAGFRFEAPEGFAVD